MIVRSLMAEGFMRYQRIELNDLPTGVIALVGDNEAGKTTLGEAVAFALFGRTIRTEDTDRRGANALVALGGRGGLQRDAVDASGGVAEGLGRLLDAVEVQVGRDGDHGVVGADDLLERLAEI